MLSAGGASHVHWEGAERTGEEHKACEKQFAENGSSARNFGFSTHCFPDGQHHCEQLQVTSSEQIWEVEMRSR